MKPPIIIEMSDMAERETLRRLRMDYEVMRLHALSVGGLPPGIYHRLSPVGSNYESTNPAADLIYQHPLVPPLPDEGRGEFRYCPAEDLWTWSSSYNTDTDPDMIMVMRRWWTRRDRRRFFDDHANIGDKIIINFKPAWGNDDA